MLFLLLQCRPIVSRHSIDVLSSESHLRPVHTVAEKWGCRRKRRENGETTAKFEDSLTFLRQCGQGFRLHAQLIPARNLFDVKWSFRVLQGHYFG